MLESDDLYSHKLFEKILDRGNDGVNVVDERVILVYVNQISADYAGTEASEMVGSIFPSSILKRFY